MVNIKVSVPDNLLLTLRENDSEFALNMKRYTALKLFETHKLSLGQSADLAQMSKADFIKYLSTNNISVFPDLTYDELQRDIDNA